MFGKRLNLQVFDADDPPSSGEPPVEPPATTTPPTSEKKTDWEAAYKGLQRNYDKLQKQFTELQGKYDQLTEESEGTKQSHKLLGTEKESIMAQNVALTKQIASLQDSETSRTLERDRYSLVLTDFPDLAAFEAKGLLPTGNNVDELREKFTKFREALGKTGDDKVKDALKGAGPGDVGDQTGKKRSKDQVYDELVAAAGKKDPEGRKKYDALMEEWIALN